MKRLSVAVALACAFPSLVAAGDKPVRVGWNAILNEPYAKCVYLEVSGPAAARAKLLKDAKAQYKEASPEQLQATDDHVQLAVITFPSLECSKVVPVELIFVDKAADKPALRLPLTTDTEEVKSDTGATWSRNNGLASLEVSKFREALAAGKFKVVVALKDGSSQEVISGLGQTTWTGSHTAKVVQ